MSDDALNARTVVTLNLPGGACAATASADSERPRAGPVNVSVPVQEVSVPVHVQVSVSAQEASVPVKEVSVHALVSLHVQEVSVSVHVQEVNVYDQLSVNMHQVSAGVRSEPARDLPAPETPLCTLACPSSSPSSFSLFCRPCPVCASFCGMSRSMPQARPPLTAETGLLLCCLFAPLRPRSLTLVVCTLRNDQPAVCAPTAAG